METAAAQTSNSLIRNEAAMPAEVPAPPVHVYDAEARNRFAFDVREGTELFETAHIFNGTADDARYMQWLREFKLTGDEENTSEESREASVRYWNDLIFQVENVTVPDGEDFRELIPAGEKIEALNSLLSVAIASDIVRVEGSRVLGRKESETVYTEAFFNGEIVKQRHVLRPVNFELQKKHARILSKRFHQERIGGLRKQPQISYRPQDHRLGDLYDEMFIEQEGFAGGIVPLRFKTAVIDHLFAERLAQKKSG